MSFENQRSSDFVGAVAASAVRPDRNIALEMVRATEAAAIQSAFWIGRGDKNAVDGAAVEAMRNFLGTVNFAGTVVIGEGEKDNAPMLYNGECLGNGMGPECDVAVDPVDGTSLAAGGRPNAISVIAVADRGSMLDASSVYYMDKFVTGPEGIGVVDIRLPMAENLRALAKAKGKPVSSLRVAILDRPRHEGLIEEIRGAGAATRLLRDGDVAGGIRAAGVGGAGIDACVGIGGSPEGVITACAIKALGGFMQGILAPQDEQERERGLAAGLAMDTVLGLDDLVASENTYFVATGVTDGQILAGVKERGGRVITESIVLRSGSGTCRRVIAEHRPEKWRS